MTTSTIPGDAQIVNLGGVFSSGNPAFLITATSSGAAHTLHTATAGVDNADTVHVWAQNTDSATSRQITLEVGGVTIGPITVQRLGAPLIVLPGAVLNNGVTVKAFASSASKIVVTAKVVRMVKVTA